MPSDVSDVIKVRRFLKERLQRDYTTFRGHETERRNVFDVINRTVELGESNSLLLLGPRSSGKTTLLNSVLCELLSRDDFQSNALVVKLDGNLHTDDRLALKAATMQMQLENVVGGKVFGSFAENLAFLLASLKAGSKQSKSVVFILDEFDLFCAHHNQTLLYNLFDVSQSAQAPICVVGVTCRLDVVELLEKRVKSRFSHRQVFLFPQADAFHRHCELFRELLTIPNDKELKMISDRIAKVRVPAENSAITFHRNHFDPSTYKFVRRFVDNWNKHIVALCAEKPVQMTLQSLYDFDVCESTLKMFLYRLVSSLNEETCKHITVEMIVQLAAACDSDDKIELLIGLSVMEICLVIAMKHHSTIYDRDPFNFEMIFVRFMKFAKVSSSMQGGIERAVALKAFEHLRFIELILPFTSGGNKVQKEFEMHKLALTFGQINQAVQRYQALPTEVAQWHQSSII